VLSALLTVLIPWSVYVINKKLHKYGDPPWKSTNEQQEQDDTGCFAPSRFFLLYERRINNNVIIKSTFTLYASIVDVV
jgi:hypothetical protein